MQIVIEVPEHIYEHIREVYEHSHTVEATYSYIYHGTPLPKGHGELIDVDRKITVSVYDEQYEEWGEETLTVREALNRWSDEGITVKDVVICADNVESEE